MNFYGHIKIAIVAAAEGLVTAAAINNWLMDFDTSHTEPETTPACRE